MPPIFQQRLVRVNFQTLLVFISLIIVFTLFNLFCLLYIATFGFKCNASDLLVWSNQLPFLFLEIIILLLMEFFTIYSASKIYSESDPSVLRHNMLRLVFIWGCLILFMIIILVQFLISNNEISQLALDDFYGGSVIYNEPSADDHSKEFVDYVQIKFQCCGSEDVWDLNKPYGYEYSFIPNSCCKSNFTGSCDKNATDQLNIKGCVKSIFDWSRSRSLTFLVLWFILISLSFAFCYLLGQIGENRNNETIVVIKSLFSNSESENLMNSNKKLRDYQNSFKKCNGKQNAFRFNDQVSPSPPTSHLNNSLSSNLNKLTKYSQIKYSKVKPTRQDDDQAELTCHQEEESSSRNNTSSSYDEESLVSTTRSIKSTSSIDSISSKNGSKHGSSSSIRSRSNLNKPISNTSISVKCDKKNSSLDKNKLKFDYSDDLKKEKVKRNELKKTKSIDETLKSKSQMKSIRKHSTTSHKLSKTNKLDNNCKSNPNYDPNFVLNSKSNSHFPFQIVDNNSTNDFSSPSSSSNSPGSDESQINDNLNLIHPKHADKTLYNLDKLKNKFIDPYLDDSSFLTDTFSSNDDDEEVSRNAFVWTDRSSSEEEEDELCCPDCRIDRRLKRR